MRFGSTFGASNYVDFPTVPPTIGASTPFTVAWTQEPRATSAYSTILNVNFGTAGVHNSFVIYLSAADSSYYFTAGPRTPGAAHSWATAAGPVTNGALDRYVLRGAAGSQSTTGSDWTLYRNGIIVARGTSTTYGANTAGGFRIGALLGATDVFEGLIGEMRLWSRALSDQEMAAESTLLGSMELYAPLARRVFVGAAGGAALQGAGTAAATGQGTLTVTSQLAGTGTTPATGSGTLTAQAALASQASATASGQGTLTVQAQLAGTGIAQASGQGTLTTGTSGAVLQSSASSSSSGQGTLTVQAQLQTLLAIAQAQASATLTVRCVLAGSASAAASGVATLSTVGPAVAGLAEPAFGRTVATGTRRAGSGQVAALLRRIGGNSL